MASWIIVLGTTPNLALSELCALFPSASFLQLSSSCVLLEGASDFSAEKLRDLAGGVVKIAEVVQTLPQVDAHVLAEIFLLLNPEPKIIFGVSRYDEGSVSISFLAEIKDLLEKAGKHARFIEGKHGTLSSVVVEKQDVDELVIAKKDGAYLVGITRAVQDFEAWNKRDYGRPYADPKAGMLPPKVARMAVNIAVGSLYSSSEESSTSREVQGNSSRQARTIAVLDPFCGMGTILGEALLRGCRVIGSDQSKDVIAKAEANLRWLSLQYRDIDALKIQLFVSDATHISQHLSPESVDAIITEPFMGTTRLGGNDTLRLRSGQAFQMANDKLKNTIKGLEKLYIGCLKDWRRVLKPLGKVVIALPQYAIGPKTYFVKKVVDNCENFGYTRLVGPIEYSRPQAVVKREFFVFQKT